MIMISHHSKIQLKHQGLSRIIQYILLLLLITIIIIVCVFVMCVGVCMHAMLPKSKSESSSVELTFFCSFTWFWGLNSGFHGKCFTCGDICIPKRSVVM